MPEFFLSVSYYLIVGSVIRVPVDFIGAQCHTYIIIGCIVLYFIYL